MQLQPTKYSIEETSGTSTTRTTYSHQRCRLGLPHFDESIRGTQTAAMLREQNHSRTASTKSIAGSQKELVDVAAPLVEDEIDPSLLLPFEMLRPVSVSTEQRINSGDGNAQVCTLRQIESTSPHSREDHDLWPRPLSTRSRPGDTSALPDARHVHLPQKKVRSSRLSCTGDKISEEDVSYPVRSTLEKQKANEVSDHRQTVISKATADRGTPEPQKMATNRNASLIDGIFRNRVTRSSGDAGDVVAEVQETRRSFLILNWMPWQPPTKRGGWLQGVKSLFPSPKSRNPNVLTKHRHTSATGNPRIASTQTYSPRRGTSNAPAASPMPRRDLGLMLDGTYDDHTSLSSSGSYLNKPLPLTPSDIVKSLSSRTRSNSYSHTFSFRQDPSTASTISTKVSKTSSKEGFQALTKDLVQSGNMKAFELSPVREADACYRRHQFDAPDLRAAPDS